MLNEFYGFIYVVGGWPVSLELFREKFIQRVWRKLRHCLIKLTSEGLTRYQGGRHEPRMHTESLMSVLKERESQWL